MNRVGALLATPIYDLATPGVIGRGRHGARNSFLRQMQEHSTVSFSTLNTQDLTLSPDPQFLS